MSYDKEQATREFSRWSAGYDRSILQWLLFGPAHTGHHCPDATASRRPADGDPRRGLRHRCIRRPHRGGSASGHAFVGWTSSTAC